MPSSMTEKRRENILAWVDLIDVFKRTARGRLDKKTEKKDSSRSQLARRMKRL